MSTIALLVPAPRGSGVSNCSTPPRWSSRRALPSLTLDAVTPDTALEELHLRLVADGMWHADLFSCYEITPEQRAALLQKVGAA